MRTPSITLSLSRSRARPAGPMTGALNPASPSARLSCHTRVSLGTDMFSTRISMWRLVRGVRARSSSSLLPACSAICAPPERLETGSGRLQMCASPNPLGSIRPTLTVVPSLLALVRTHLPESIHWIGPPVCELPPVASGYVIAPGFGLACTLAPVPSAGVSDGASGYRKRISWQLLAGFLKLHGPSLEVEWVAKRRGRDERKVTNGRPAVTC